jgi:VIT1/CCC1 family predicted Fe2+/Mn2+ transporter
MRSTSSSSTKTTGQAFIVALILHGAILLILGAYIAYTQLASRA